MPATFFKMLIAWLPAGTGALDFISEYISLASYFWLSTTVVTGNNLVSSVVLLPNCFFLFLMPLFKCAAMSRLLN